MPAGFSPYRHLISVFPSFIIVMKEIPDIRYMKQNRLTRLFPVNDRDKESL